MTAAAPTMPEEPSEDRAWPGADQVGDRPSPGPAARDGADGGRARRPRRWSATSRRAERKLPLKTRIVLGVAGGLLIVLGIAGLFLPFLQGILFLVLGGAVLSLTSFTIYRWLGRTMGDRWPGAWDRVERFRTRVRWKLRR